MELDESGGCCALGYTKATAHSVLPRAPQSHHAPPPAWWPGQCHSDRKNHLLHSTRLGDRGRDSWGQAAQGSGRGSNVSRGMSGVRWAQRGLRRRQE